MSEISLDDLLNDDVEIEEPKPETAEEDNTEAEPEEAQETESTEESAGSPSEPENQQEEETDSGESFTDREKAFLAKANDEKAKRQELERKLSEKEKPEPESLPDPIQDPEGYANALEKRNAASQFQMRVSVSQELMREKYADYEEKEAAFIELAQKDPLLASQMQNSSNPAKFAYDTAVRYERMAQFDNFDSAVKAEVDKQVVAARESIEKSIRAELEAQLKEATSLPPSGTKGSLGTDNTVPGEESLADILGESS